MSQYGNIILRNSQLEIGINEMGGIFSYLKHVSSNVNPLDFKYSYNDEENQYFNGHFICTPRWGDVTPGEEDLGLLKHGDCWHLPWIIRQENEHMAKMHVCSTLELLSVTREIQLHSQAPVFSVCETLKNHAPVYRPCNFVQHPTIAGDFLNNNTRVDCNAAAGWRDVQTGQLPIAAGNWPYVYNSNEQIADIRMPIAADKGVYSFSLNSHEIGWVTALDLTSHLLLGYCWSAKDYPFIHHWIHAEEQNIKYRGIEFGTAALHQPFSIQQNQFFKWQDAPSCFFLDAGASATFQYECFLCNVDENAIGVRSLSKDKNLIQLQLEGSNDTLILSTL